MVQKNRIWKMRPPERETLITVLTLNIYYTRTEGDGQMNLIATHIGRKTILIRDMRFPFRQETIQGLIDTGWVVKQWEPTPKLDPLFVDLFKSLKVS